MPILGLFLTVAHELPDAIDSDNFLALRISPSSTRISLVLKSVPLFLTKKLFFSIFPISTKMSLSVNSFASSCKIILSAPSGKAAPVNILTASPGLIFLLDFYPAKLLPIIENFTILFSISVFLTA